MSELLFPMVLGLLVFLIVIDAWLWQKKMAERKKNEKAVAELLALRKQGDAGVVDLINRLYPNTAAPHCTFKHEIGVVEGQGPIIAAILNSCYVVIATVFAAKGFGETARYHASAEVIIALTKRTRGNRPESWLVDRAGAREIFEATLAWAAEELDVPLAELISLREEN